ncbi:MAG: DivIVA domain-containing protein [Clostridia bacterium]|jgi:cell division initiation protein|nr:DivIVA domain-containing protein [Clostridia bacterium]
MERVTVDLISTKEFPRVNKGYDPKEVDEFLDDICDEMERMEAEIKDLRQQTASVRPAPAPAPAAANQEPDEEITSQFREILTTAQQVKEETIRKAKEDAEAIRAKAEAEATERLDGLNEERDALTKQITELKATAANYRQQFEQLLQAQQEALEKATNLF